MSNLINREFYDLNYDRGAKVEIDMVDLKKLVNLYCETFYGIPSQFNSPLKYRLFKGLTDENFNNPFKL